MKKALITLATLLVIITVKAQDSDSLRIERLSLDSMFISEVEEPKGGELKPKILHAEPLYIDLIRDLGARKGEKEWNVGFGMFNKRDFNKYEALVEYEWAPIDRLGFEIEVPVTIFTASEGTPVDITRPANRIESLKLATQWTFLVSEKSKDFSGIGLYS
jgi:hypothetical protein